VRPVDHVLERLKDTSAHNGYVKALCPAHDDREPSLSVSEADDGRVLIKCHAGCRIEDIVAAIGLETKDLFADKEGGRRCYIPAQGCNGATPPKKPRGNTQDTVAGVDARPDNSATPGLHLVKDDREGIEDCTLAQYAEYLGLPIDFLRSLELKEIYYIDRKAVKIPYLDAAGAEEICVRFRVSLTGKPKVKTRKGNKHQLYGLWKLEEARQAGYVIAVEGESDTQTGWYHSEPVVGVPGASGFQDEWAAKLEGIGKVYAIVEPDEGGEAFWQRLAATDLRNRLYKVELDGVKDLRDLHRSEADVAAFKDRLHDALRRARHWVDVSEIETHERAREAWARCEGLARSEDILERFYETLRASGVAGERRGHDPVPRVDEPSPGPAGERRCQRPLKWREELRRRARDGVLPGERLLRPDRDEREDACLLRGAYKAPVPRAL
jgi:hypothetical protein